MYRDRASSPDNPLGRADKFEFEDEVEDRSEELMSSS